MRLLALLAGPLHACAVCFGETGDPNISRAYLWGIVLMLGVTAGLLAAIGIAIYRIEAAHREASASST